MSGGGVTRWRKRPVEVDMILWDGSQEAWQLIANHGGLPERVRDGSLNIWVEKSQAEMNLDLGAWAIIEPDGSGVYPCTKAAQADTYDPADSAGAQVETAARADERERIAREFERVADELLADRPRLSDRILHPAMAEIYRHCAEIARATTEVGADG